MTSNRCGCAVLTQQVSREVDGQDDADGEDSDHDQQADDVTLEGKVVNGILPTFLPDLLIPAGGGRPVSQFYIRQLCVVSLYNKVCNNTDTEEVD